MHPPCNYTSQDCDRDVLLLGIHPENMTEPSAPPSDPERPATAVVRETRPPSRRDEPDDDDREALELQEIQTREDRELDYSTPSASSGEEYRVNPRRTTSRRSVRRPRVDRKGPWRKFSRFWTHHVTLTVSHKTNRDHFGR